VIGQTLLFEVLNALLALAGVGHWLDPSSTWIHLAGGTVNAATWAHVAATAAVWIALPAAAGLWRVLRRPVG
jgi:ABC-2 type transport system permease protein